MFFCCCCWVAAEFENEKDGLSEHIVHDIKRTKKNKNFQKIKEKDDVKRKEEIVKMCWVVMPAGRANMRMLLVKPISVKIKN